VVGTTSYSGWDAFVKNNEDKIRKWENGSIRKEINRSITLSNFQII
jgi:hypothetical protein